MEKEIDSMNDFENAELLQVLFTGETYVIPETDAINLFSLGEKLSKDCRLLFILKNENHETASAREVEVLQKTVDWKDLKLSREEVAVINIALQSVSFPNLTNQCGAKNIIVFGIEPSEIGLNIELHSNRVFKFRDMNFIFTSSIEELLKNEIIKSKFFAAIKSMFK